MATGDEEYIKKSNELMAQNLANSLDRGKTYFLQYFAVGQWLFALLDHSETLNRQGYTTRSANWFRVAVQELMLKTGVIPDWMEEYYPQQQTYNLWEKVMQTIFRTRSQYKEESEETLVIPYEHNF